MDPLFPVAPDFAEVSTEDLAAFIEENGESIGAVSADPASFVTQERTSAQLLEDMTAAVEAQEAAKARYAELTAEVEEVEEVEEPSEEFAAQVAELAARANAEVETVAVEEAVTAEAEEPTADPPADEPEEPEEEPEEEVTAAAPAPVTTKALARPATSRRAVPMPSESKRVALTAAAGGLGADLGAEIDLMTAAAMMIKARTNFGQIAPGMSERYPIAKANWQDDYPAERRLGRDPMTNMDLVASVTDPAIIKKELKRRREDKSLTASGGLCAPVTPYYGLMDISTATRPVRAGLPAFGADRGGLNFGRPASLSDITTAVGAITAAADAAGGTFATKTCQRIECPDFEEVDVDTLYHCLEVGNLLSRTFPELVAQWTSLTMSAHARLAESRLLTGIDEASTEVVAGNLGLGASASLFSQYLAAANGYRNRHRMDPEAVLRLMLPDWSIDLIISDVIRSQFQRFDTDEAKVTALLRSFDIEPSFYIDGAAGRGQVFGSQTAGDLLPFPSEVVGYLFSEGSFLYLDGGTLELGLVRDSVLNQTNDYQLFGETFENVAFLGIESLAIVSSVCDSGTVSLPDSVTCPIDYTPAS